MTKVLRALAATAILAFCLQTFANNKADVDLWGNVGFTTALPNSPDFHRTNTYSFTNPHHPWINHEWLSQYILHQIHDNMGAPGLLLTKTLVGLLLILLIDCSMRRDNVSRLIRFFFLLLAISTIGYGFSTRPHLFTYLLYTLFLFLLRHQRHRTAILLPVFPMLGLLWTNLHGAFFIGILLLFLFIVMETIARFIPSSACRPQPHMTGLIAALLLFVGLTFVNPYGARLWNFIFESAAKPRPYLSEWAPFDPQSHFATHIDFVVLALISLLAILFSRKKKELPEVGILLVSFIAACWLRRNIPLFAITAAFVIPSYADDLAGQSLERMAARIPKAVLAAILALVIMTSAGFTLRFDKSRPLQIEIPQNRFPSEIIRFMGASDIRGNALIFFDWAEYSIWKLPHCRVFLDGRFNDAYDEHIIDDYFNFLYLGPHWENALLNYPVNIMLLHRGNPVFKRMMQNDDWQVVCTNGIAGLFLKKSEHQDLIARLQTGEIRPPSTEAEREVFFP